MRCYCCQNALSDYESTLRHRETNDFVDMCTKCLDGLNIPTIGNSDNSNKEPDEFEWPKDDYYD